MRPTLWILVVLALVAFMIGGAFAVAGRPASIALEDAPGVFMCTGHSNRQDAISLPFRVTGPRNVWITEVALVSPGRDVSLDEARIGPVEFEPYYDPVRDHDPATDVDVGDLPSAVDAKLNSGYRGRLYLRYSYPLTRPAGFEAMRITYRSGWFTRSIVVGPGADGC